MTKGYYSIIQYCPDLSRLEAANIGVILFCPELRFLRAKTSTGNERIRRFFGLDSRDWERISFIKKTIEKRLTVEAGAFHNLEDLEKFVASRANDLLLSAPRSLLVDNPEEELDRLFELLVVGHVKETTRDAAAPIKRKLQQEFRRADVLQFLHENITIEVPAFQSTITIPYAYQNGRFNLIQPLKFEQSTSEGVIVNACRYAVEGRSIYLNRHQQLGDMQLNVVASFSSGANKFRETAREILTENDVKFYDADSIPTLTREIRETAKEPPQMNLMDNGA